MKQKWKQSTSIDSLKIKNYLTAGVVEADVVVLETVDDSTPCCSWWEISVVNNFEINK